MSIFRSGSSLYSMCGGNVPESTRKLAFSFIDPQNEMNCTWNITRSYDFKLTFTMMRFGEKKCTYSYMQVDNLVRFCQKSTPDVYSRNWSLFLKFVSRYSDTGAGFIAEIVRVKGKICNTIHMFFLYWYSIVPHRHYQFAIS